RGERLLEPRSVVRVRGAVPGGRAAAETVCRAGRAHLEIDARRKHEAGPGTRNHASEASDVQAAAAPRLDEVPREAKTPTVVREPREREGFDRQARLLDGEPLAPPVQEQPDPRSLLHGMQTDPAVPRDLARGVEPVPEPRP